MYAKSLHHFKFVHVNEFISHFSSDLFQQVQDLLNVGLSTRKIKTALYQLEEKMISRQLSYVSLSSL